MDDEELKQFCYTVGILVKAEWDRSKVMHAISLAMYDASAAKIANK